MLELPGDLSLLQEALPSLLVLRLLRPQLLQDHITMEVPVTGQPHPTDATLGVLSGQAVTSVGF